MLQEAMHRRKTRYSFPNLGEPSAGGSGQSGHTGTSGDAQGGFVPAPGERVLSVGEISRGIRRILESSFNSVAVRGEVTGLGRPGSGHIYFNLRDGGGLQEAQIAVVLWREGALRLRFPLDEGMRVIVRGRVAVYEPRGIYQVVAERIDPDGLGEIALALDRLKRKLAQEGLFDPRRKQPLPFLPEQIGIITSPSGAALWDILRSIYRRHPGAQVRIIPVRVQGEGAAEEIEAALAFAGSPEAGVSVVIVGRGGGSAEDLWAFNEEGVVRAVAACRVPVISAIGHEVDFTLCDFAADARAQTPTHAGELVVPDVEALRLHFGSLEERLLGAVLRKTALCGEACERLASRPVLRHPREQVLLRGRKLDDLGRRLWKELYSIHTRWHDKILVFSGRLDALNPLAVLRRGYSVAFDLDGKVVRDAALLHAGQALRVVLAKGSASVRVESIEAGHGG